MSFKLINYVIMHFEFVLECYFSHSISLHFPFRVILLCFPRNQTNINCLSNLEVLKLLGASSFNKLESFFFLYRIMASNFKLQLQNWPKKMAAKMEVYNSQMWAATTRVTLKGVAAWNDKNPMGEGSYSSWQLWIPREHKWWPHQSWKRRWEWIRL